MPPLRQLLDYMSKMSHKPLPLSRCLNRSAGRDQLYLKSALKKRSNANNTKNKIFRNLNVIVSHKFYAVNCVIVQSLIPLAKFHQAKQITTSEKIFDEIHFL